MQGQIKTILALNLLYIDILLTNKRENKAGVAPGDHKIGTDN